MKRTFSMAVCGAVAVGGLFAGCTTSTPGTQATGEPPLGTIPVISTPEQVSLPIYSFLPTVDQTVSLMMEDRALVNQCAQENGSTEQAIVQTMDFHGDTGGQATPSDLAEYATTYRAEDVTYSGMWGFFDPETVSQYGYNRPPDSQFTLSTYVGQTGSALNDCVNRVSEITPGKSAMGQVMISSLPDGGPAWHSDDSRYVAVEQEWSTCMKGKGFTYDTPWAALGDNSRPTDDQTRAKAVALADVDCKISTNLLGEAVAVQSAYEQLYIDSHRDALAKWQQYLNDYLAGNIKLPPSPTSATPS